MESVIETVLERVGDREVRIVRLWIGELSGVSVDALRFGFDVCACGTTLATAELDIVTIAGTAHCKRCGREEPIRAFGAPCSCGSPDRELIHGDELLLKEVEVA